jgi:ribonucleoside-diphosphate reductase beta chain
MTDQFWERTVGGHFVLPKRSFWPDFFSQVVARSQWNPEAIDLTPDARTWQELPAERRRRLMTLLAGFCVAEDAVSEHITPFADAARGATLASQESLMAWVFFLQRRDEDRHARFFDRIAAEVLGVPGDTPAERREAARPHVPPAVLELFEERLPAMTAELAAGRSGLAEGVSLYHMLLEGVVFLAGQHALLEDLADGALAGVREGLERVQLDERWHVGFGLRCLIECQPSRELLDELLAQAEDATGAWGDVLPASTREFLADLSHHRLSAVWLIDTHVGAQRRVGRAPAA